MLKALDNDHFYLDDDLVDLVQMAWNADQVKEVWHNHEMHLAICTLRNYARRLANPANTLPIREDAVRRALKRYNDLYLKAHQRVS